VAAVAVVALCSYTVSWLGATRAALGFAPQAVLLRRLAWFERRRLAIVTIV